MVILTKDNQRMILLFGTLSLVTDPFLSVCNQLSLLDNEQETRCDCHRSWKKIKTHKRRKYKRILFIGQNNVQMFDIRFHAISYYMYLFITLQ